MNSASTLSVIFAPSIHIPHGPTLQKIDSTDFVNMSTKMLFRDD